MAVSLTNYFSNSIIGVPQVGADIDIYEVSTNPKYAVGFGFERADGNKYRYCHFGLLSPVGYIVGQDSLETSVSASNIAPTGTNNVQRAGETLRPNYAGARYIQLLLTATADQFAGGYITVISGSGSGYTYRIAGNTASSDSVPQTGHIYVDLYDPIIRPIGTDSDFAITGCLYANLEPAISPNSGTAAYCVPVGVPVTGMSATNWGWVQTKGLASVLTGIAGSQGGLALVSGTTPGATTTFVYNSTTCFVISPIVGSYVIPSAAAAYSQIKLTLE